MSPPAAKAPHPKPTTVWAVRLEVSTEDFKGVLSMDTQAGDLVFTHEDDELRIGLGTIRKVKRLRGSPVLTVEAATDALGAERARYAFYFAPPPPLKPPQGGGGRRKNTRKSVMYLQREGSAKKERLRAWEAALKERARS